MISGKNQTFQVGLNSSPYALGQNYDAFLEELAKTEIVNLIVNDGMNSIENGVLLGWTASGASTVAVSSGFTDIILQSGSSLYQIVSDGLEPNSAYTAVVYSQKTLATSASTFNIEVVPTSANQVFNRENYSQSPAITATFTHSGTANYERMMMQFNTGTKINQPIIFKISNTTASACRINVKFISLYKGLIEYGKLLPKELTSMRSLERGTSATPSIAFYNDKDTGIYSPGANQFTIVASGIPRIVINDTNLSLGTSAGLNIDLNTTSRYAIMGSGTSSFVSRLDAVSGADVYTTGANAATNFKHNGFTVYDTNNFNINAFLGGSVAERGYQWLPNGLLLQWGKDTINNGTAIYFPIAFPNAAFSVTSNFLSGFDAHIYTQSCTIVNRSYFSGTNQRHYLSYSGAFWFISAWDTVDAEIYWMAIGY